MKHRDPFLLYLKFEKKYSEHTITSYQNDINQYEQYLITHMDINDLLLASQTHVRSWIVSLMRLNYSAKSINRKLSSLKSFYKYQKKIGASKSNPASKVAGPKLSKRLPSVVKTNDIDRGLQELKLDNSFEALRDLLVFNLLYQTGIRRSELINLKDLNVNFARNSIKVLGKGGKERLVPVSDALITSIKKYIDLRDDTFESKPVYLLVTDRGQKMYPKFVYNKVNRWLSTISTIEKRSPHILRHSFATHLADNGAELNAIKELLGHASLAATEIYTHNSIERLKDVYQKAHPKARKKR